MASRSRAVVVGAGAAGLISARHLLREGLSVTVLEQSDRVGGIWTHHDVPGCPIYDSLRTNLPSSVMGLSDWPFPEQVPSFMPHAHVGDFLTSYAEARGVVPHVRLRHTVTRVEAIPAAPALPAAGQPTARQSGLRATGHATVIRRGTASQPRCGQLPRVPSPE